MMYPLVLGRDSHGLAIDQNTRHGRRRSEEVTMTLDNPTTTAAQLDGHTTYSPQGIRPFIGRWRISKSRQVAYLKPLNQATALMSCHLLLVMKLNPHHRPPLATAVNIGTEVGRR